MAVTVLSTATVFAQDETRSSSSMNLPVCQQADVTVAYDVTAEGKRFAPTWGLDLAWISEQNLMKGVNHMGKDNVGIGRTSFRVLNPLVNDVSLTDDQIEGLRTRSNLFNKVRRDLPLVLNCDNGYRPENHTGSNINTYYTANRKADIGHWAAAIDAHVKWMKENTKHPIVGISPFNEPDFDGNEKELIQGTAQNQADVARKLRQDYAADMEDIVMTGGNTLNNNKAIEWYTPGKDCYEWGNTHQLAGSMDTFIAFYDQLQKDGKVGYGDEMHNVIEPMVGLEHGMTVGIWWGFDSRARGEFCDISRNGVRLAYGEHRNNWTAASVYRHDDGRVKAFVGSSERDGATTSYQFVSAEREVYYDGYGPYREFVMTIPGGTGYQKGQTNAERVIDVTWGADVAPSVISGKYKIYNAVTGAVITCPSNGTAIAQSKFTGDESQYWNVKPSQSTAKTLGDYSFLDIESAKTANVRMNVRNFSLTGGAEIIAWTQSTPSSNEQWYAVYAGNGYYYLRNRESALYLTSNGTATTAKVIQDNLKTGNASKRQMWRFVPVDVDYETVAPTVPLGLSAHSAAASVRLEWTAGTEEDLDGYMILRADKETRTWNTIARKVKTAYYVDNTCRQGKAYYYRVRAIDRAENISEWSDSVEASPSGKRALVAQWNMNDNTYDATVNMMDAVEKTTAARFVAGPADNTKALNLTASKGEYVQLPYEVASSDELTIALWVNWRNSSNWQRIFDFGIDTEHYMFLTPVNSYTSKMRFAIKNGGDEQFIDCPSKLTAMTWKHVVVTIGHQKTAIYVDGEEVASSTGITIRPSDLHPVLNYLGRSQFTADPYFTGYVSDVRIYNYAATADEVKDIMAGKQLGGIGQAAPAADARPVVYGLDGVRRSAPRPGLNIIDGKKAVLKR